MDKKKKWIRVKIEKNNNLDLLIERLVELGTTGILETTDGVESYFPYQRRFNSISAIKKYLSHVDEEDTLIKYEIIEDEDWHLRWQDNFKPLLVTPHIMVVPIWKQVEFRDGIVIRIKPGQAFGTGTHESTQLALTLIESYLKPGDRVLDAGCGSGILSIAAWKLGASEVVSMDVDTLAEENFLENAEANGLRDTLTFSSGDVTRLKSYDYDLIMANIELNTLKKLLRKILKGKHRPLLIFSGLLNEDLPAIEKTAGNLYQIIDQTKKGEWIALALKGTER